MSVVVVVLLYHKSIYIVAVLYLGCASDTQTCSTFSVVTFDVNEILGTRHYSKK